MQRTDYTAKKIKYLRDNIECFRFIAVNGLSGNHLYSEFVGVLEKPNSKADAIITYMSRMIDELSVPVTEEGLLAKLKRSKSSSESSGEEEMKMPKPQRPSGEKAFSLKAIRTSKDEREMKPLRVSVGGVLKSRRNSKEEYTEFDTVALGGLKQFAQIVKEDLKNNQISLDEFIDKVDPAISQMSNATANQIRDWAWRNKK